MNSWFKESDVFYSSDFDKLSLGFQIHKYPEKLIKREKSVTIEGIEEEIADSIRKELYKTYYQFENIYLTDLGNVRKNNAEFVVSILKELVENDTNIIVLGGTKEIFETQLRALKSYSNNISFIEKSGDLLFDERIQKILKKNNQKLNKIKLIGYQTHLVHSSMFDKNLINNSIRLGQIRTNYTEIEPFMRNIDLALFNMDSIRYSEVPGQKNTSPSGLTSEEACQIVRYLGLNTSNNILSIMGYTPKYDFNNQAAMLISQLIWYYLDGLDNMIYDDLVSSKSLTKYIVELSDYNLSLHFFQSVKSGRWWVKIPQEQENHSYYLPCSEDDYNKATKNELSIRIFNELSL